VLWRAAAEAIQAYNVDAAWRASEELGAQRNAAKR
jgi:hypothetical protein